MISNHQNYQRGYDYARGALSAVSLYVCVALLALIVLNFARNRFGWGVDDSDKDGRNRSGLRVHVDHKTGIEYLSDGNGGLVRRDGRPSNP